MSVLVRAPRHGILRVCLCSFALTLLLVRNCYTQAVAVAEVDGRVTDQSGASVSAAQVKITNADTQQVRQTTTDSDGRYQLPNLPVGNYQFEVSANGFKTYVQQGIVLQVGQNISNNVTMQIGAVSESVEVTAATAMVETKDNSISQVIDQKRIVDLPLKRQKPHAADHTYWRGNSCAGWRSDRKQEHRGFEYFGNILRCRRTGEWE